jgi:hypothetical protein
MINLDLGGNGDVHLVTEEIVNEAIQALENPAQKVGLHIFFCMKINYFFSIGSCFKMS